MFNTYRLSGVAQVPATQILSEGLALLLPTGGLDATPHLNSQ